MSGIDTMKSGDFSIMEQEHDSLGEKGSQQDDVRDMARLGKKQQFEVCPIPYNTSAVTMGRLSFRSVISSSSLSQRFAWLQWVDGSLCQSKPITTKRFPHRILTNLCSNSSYGLSDGGTGATIVMYLVNFASFSSIILSLAEMSSM